MVLGLTMAEIVILIIFILLLIISIFLTQRDERLAELDRDLADKSRQTNLLQEQVKLLKEFAPGEENFDELFNKLVIKRQEAIELKERVAVLIEEHKTLVEKVNSFESEKSRLEEIMRSDENIRRTLSLDGKNPLEALHELRAAKIQRDQLAEALARQGLDPSDPTSLEKALADVKDSVSLLQALAEAGFDTSDVPGIIADMAQAQSTIEDLQSQLADAKKGMYELRRQLEVLGKGQHPPCWYKIVTRRNGKPRERGLYIFHVNIFDNNVFVKDIPAPTPEYALQKPALLFNRSALNKNISFGEFVKSFKPLKDAGENRKVQDYPCKFYVKVWEATTSKKKYRRALEKVVETVFFTYLVEDEPWPY